MKLLIQCFLLILFINSSVFANAQKDSLNEKKEKIEIVFTPSQTLKSLLSIEDSLLSNFGIELEYKELYFNSKGYLSGISFEVDCKDGFKGSAKNSAISKRWKFGFFRDYSKDSDTPFGTGLINEKSSESYTKIKD